MNVSIILVNYNTRALTVDCINSIYKQTKGVEFEIIVVDNASVDDSCEAISKEHPKVVLIKSSENLGFGRANNLGIEVAKGEYIFLLNSDTILLNNAVKLFYDYAVQKESVHIGAIGAVLLGADMKPTHSYADFITISNTLLKCIPVVNKFVDKQKFPNEGFVSKNVEYITGADIFVPKKVIDEIGGFDPMFFMYCEEVDLQYRMFKRNYQRIVIEAPQIIHLEGGSDSSVSSKLWSYSRMSNIIRSRLKYIKKHNSKLSYILFRALYLPMRMISVMLSKYTFKQKKDIFKILLTRKVL